MRDYLVLVCTQVLPDVPELLSILTVRHTLLAWPNEWLESVPIKIIHHS